MLLPFDKTLFMIDGLQGRYIPSVLNDLFRVESDISGYMMCVDEEYAGYVFFENGRITDAVAHHFSPEQTLPLAIPFSHFLDEGVVDIYINAIEDITFLHSLREHLISHASVVANTDLLSPVHIVNYVKQIKYTGLVSVRHGVVNNMLVFKRGKFESLLYYHPDSHGFVRERNVATFKEYIMSIADMSPVFIMHNGAALKKTTGRGASSVPLQKDILVNILLCYFDLFDMAVDIMKELFTPLVSAKIVNKVIREIQQKYYPLYSSVVYNEETSSANWHAILGDRRYIPVEYRFEYYHLYLDELFTLLMAALVSRKVPAAFEIFRERVDTYIRHLDERDRDLRKMVFRIQKMIEKIDKQQ
ncbi:hypothetical protein KAH37_09120 [bacterium]|nr:hypothetical protein [bacterium]